MTYPSRSRRRRGPSYGGGEPELGPELIANGSFDTPTDWDLDADWSITGGQAVYTPGGAVNNCSQTSLGLVDGNTYRVSFDYTNTGVLRLRFGQNNDTTTISDASGTFTQDISLNLGGSFVDVIRFRPNASTTALTIDNVSVRQVI